MHIVLSKLAFKKICCPIKNPCNTAIHTPYILIVRLFTPVTRGKYNAAHHTKATPTTGYIQ